VISADAGENWKLAMLTFLEVIVFGVDVCAGVGAGGGVGVVGTIVVGVVVVGVVGVVGALYWPHPAMTNRLIAPRSNVVFFMKL
jgi:hypothetical protein